LNGSIREPKFDENHPSTIGARLGMNFRFAESATNSAVQHVQLIGPRFDLGPELRKKFGKLGNAQRAPGERRQSAATSGRERAIHGSEIPKA
jgi:hypothetical protein